VLWPFCHLARLENINRSGNFSIHEQTEYGDPAGIY
jgi:hypothetical protein